MILRELLASFGLDFDAAGAKRADDAVKGLKSNFEGLGRALEGSAIVLFFRSTLDAASALQEAIVRTSGLFGEGAGAVNSWAEAMSGPLGRGKGTLLELATSIGAVTNSFAKSETEAGAMATTMAELAVNMAGFFGTDEQQTLEALRGGLMGSYRALRIYGIQLDDTSLADFAHAQGIHKSIKSMTDAEKAILRYRKILASTTKVQGAGVASLNRYAGASRALGERFTSLKEATGASIMGPATQLLTWARDGLEWFMKLAENTNLLGAAMGALALAAGAILLPILWGLLAPLIPLIVVFAAFAFVMDDVITTLQGGDSVIGAFNRTLNEWYDTVMKMDLTNSPILNFLRDLLHGLNEAKKIGFGFIMKLMGDESGMKEADAEHYANLAKQGVFHPGTPEYDKLMSGTPGFLSGGGSITRSKKEWTTVQQGNRTYQMNITQQPGENSEHFAQRVAEIIDESNVARDEQLKAEFLPAPQAAGAAGSENAAGGGR